MNKIYLSCYKNYSVFWQELGTALRNYQTVFRSKGDYEKVGLTIREAAIFLYIQWYFMSEQRFLHLVSSDSMIPEENKNLEKKEDSPIVD